MSDTDSTTSSDGPDRLQGHAPLWPSTPYSDEARSSPPPLESARVIALLGDCTVACTYFPPANRPDHHLTRRLRRAIPDKPVVVRNLAADGESASDFLRSERIGSELFALPRLDAVLVRYGINDRKRDGVVGCIRNLTALCVELRQRFEGVAICIETGIWVDYPAHYLWDRNAALAPLYAAMHAFAEQEGYTLVDIFAQIQEQTRRGNWDLRVRGLPTPEHLVVDDSFDDYFGDDPAFFTNIHPNSRCLSLIAKWQSDALVPLLTGVSPLLRGAGDQESVRRLE